MPRSVLAARAARHTLNAALRRVSSEVATPHSSAYARRSRLSAMYHCCACRGFLQTSVSERSACCDAECE